MLCRLINNAEAQQAQKPTTCLRLVTHILKTDCWVLCRLINDAETKLLAQQAQKLTTCLRLVTHVLKSDCWVLCRLINDAETNLLAQQADKRRSSSEGSSQGLCTTHKASLTISEGLLRSVTEVTEEEVPATQQASLFLYHLLFLILSQGLQSAVHTPCKFRPKSLKLMVINPCICQAYLPCPVQILVLSFQRPPCSI